MMIDFPNADPVERGCGQREQGGVYAECGLSPYGCGLCPRCCRLPGCGFAALCSGGLTLRLPLRLRRTGLALRLRFGGARLPLRLRFGGARLPL